LQTHNRILHLTMRHVSPPRQHVGRIEHVLRQPVVGLVERRRAQHEFIIGAKRGGDTLVHAFRVNVGDDLVFLLVNVLAPNRHADSIGFMHCVVYLCHSKKRPRKRDSIPRVGQDIAGTCC
jgi:hypothetical protein